MDRADEPIPNMTRLPELGLRDGTVPVCHLFGQIPTQADPTEGVVRGLEPSSMMRVLTQASAPRDVR